MHSTKRSIFFPRAAGREISEIDSAHYTEMFREDLSMLLPGYHEAKSAIRLEPADANAEKLIEESLRIHYIRADFAAAVSEFIRLAARTIAGYGNAVYEISYESVEPNQDPVAFHFHSIDPESVVIRRGEVNQRIEPDVARERQVQEWIHIPKETLLMLVPPRGWAQEFRRICCGLTILSGQLIPEFAYPAVARQPYAVPIDTMQYLKTQELAVLAVTKRTGWNARGTSSGKITGYYWFRRWLRFEKLKIELRNSLIDCLNEGLRRVGKRLKMSSRIVTSGLPTLPDIASVEEKLQSGSNVLGEIMKPFLRA